MASSKEVREAMLEGKEEEGHEPGREEGGREGGEEEVEAFFDAVEAGKEEEGKEGGNGDGGGFFYKLPSWLVRQQGGDKGLILDRGGCGGARATTAAAAGGGGAGSSSSVRRIGMKERGGSSSGRGPPPVNMDKYLREWQEKEGQEGREEAHMCRQFCSIVSCQGNGGSKNDMQKVIALQIDFCLVFNFFWWCVCSTFLSFLLQMYQQSRSSHV